MPEEKISYELHDTEGLVIAALRELHDSCDSIIRAVKGLKGRIEELEGLKGRVEGLEECTVELEDSLHDLKVVFDSRGWLS